MVFAIAGRKLVNAIETVKSDIEDNNVYLNIDNINNILYIVPFLYILSSSLLIFREFKRFIVF
jgi:hypothetical protein